MSVLKALQLAPPAALLKAMAGALDGGDPPSADHAGGVEPPAEKKASAKRKATPAELADDAKWPAKAHLAWKKLDLTDRNSVVSQMAKRYGADFAKAFVERTAGGQRIESHDYVPALPEQTSEYMKAKGYALAQKGGTDEIGQEWWVHPNGHEIYLQRHLPGWKPQEADKTPPTPPTPPTTQPPPLPKPPPTTGACDAGEQQYLAMALKWLKDALKAAKEKSEQWAAAQAKLDRMDTTSPEYEKAFKAQGEQLKKDEAWLAAQIDELETAEASIKDSGCDATGYSSDLNALREKGFERDSAQMTLDMRKPLHVGLKDDDDDGDSDE